MEIEFDFKKEQSRLLGPVLRPVARITLVNQEIEVPEHLYVDSGADLTLIPKSVGDLLGFKVSQGDSIEEIKGVGERGIPVVIKKVEMRICKKAFEARVAWALIEEVPLLLGRADVFALFNVCFKKNTKTVFED
ncbi:hypothetical protein HYV85_06120 [Candidatus Woesearchaeota archaeon]|nr:hypothetical protein [Candidatus Woesearchaeota archaeon]MBI3037411.1 hypothetical protein [Candidatus Woesearchaeota archaeon]